MSGVFLLAALLACGATQSQNPKTAASSVLACPEKQINISDPDDDFGFAAMHARTGAPKIVRADGCGRAEAFVESCKRTADDGKECHWVSATVLRNNALKKRASFDLACASGLLEITELDATSSGVTGCGRRVTYVWTCPHNPVLWSSKCSWIMNNETKLPGPKPAGEPPETPKSPPSAPPTDVPPAEGAPVQPAVSAL